MRFDRASVLATFAAATLFAASVSAQTAPAAAGQAVQPADDHGVDLRDEQARALFEAGRVAFTAGRFEDALDSFTQAYELSGKPILLYNIGQAADRLRMDERTIEAFEQYLAAVPDAAHRSSVQRRVEVLRRALERQQPSSPAPVVDAAPAQGNAPAPSAVDVFGSDTGPARRDAADQGGMTSKWWFWTAVGVVVAGGLTAAIVAAGSEDSRQKPLALVDHTFTALTLP